ncbi:MAG: response regulator [Candidatus Moranbacteria bacterium]|nr:response regulator [Candidatus Moranbacteria bacterium]
MAKIMIVEDDPMLVEIYEKKLLDTGFEIKIVTSGKAVKDEALLWHPDLILLDVVLPDMDGFEILEAVKKENEIKSIPVYVFSNLSAKEDIDRATSLGAAGFLTKSNFTPSQLAEEVKKLVGDQSSSSITSPPEPSQSASPTEEFPLKKETGGHKVLIIEDEDIFIEMFGDKLKQEGFEVVAAKNGKWGIKEAEKGLFDCVLLDMMMPAMNGYEAIKELRANEATKNTPVIILSNSAMDSEVKQALDLGADAYYVKTQITPGEVVKKVKELIGNKK